MALRKFVAGNWKMHGLSADLAEIRAIADGAEDYPRRRCRALRAEHPDRAGSRGGSATCRSAAQDVHCADKGAHTGCISAAMLADAGARLTIVGHSERREAQHESNEDVKAKAEAALAAGLEVIFCIGESLDVRETGDAVATVQAQLDASLPHGEGSGFGRAFEFRDRL